MGEKTVRGNVSSGDGIWKSENARKTWKHIGLKNSRHITRVKIHPKNPNIVFAGVMGDLYKQRFTNWSLWNFWCYILSYKF
ncbi:hypothetical protein [uncultured Polaribacter sp.]|uniref:hypothetical protein n=1 Tax=uncultured Polaribacter sp. TaxID=174711 RepID=UPI003458288D